MKKAIGISGLLFAICLITAWFNRDFLSGYNLENLVQRISLYGVIGIGAAFVIITGGIDLSIGSVIGLVGCLLPYLLVQRHVGVAAALLFVLAVAVAIGLVHGLLITKLKLQPFVVTLCGLLLYRGLARWITDDSTQGFRDQFEGLRMLATGRIALPMIDEFELPIPFVVLVAISLLAAVFLNRTIYGRYLFALGRNEQAARYSGINTDRMVILAYVLCSLLAGIGGMLFALDLNSIQPASHGEFYELYAIAAAVLGGCSLRGGEGSIVGVVVGTAVIRVLYNSIILLDFADRLEDAIIGLVIVAGVIVDELVKRLAAKRRAARQARALG